MIDIAALRSSGLNAEQILTVVENWFEARKQKERNRLKRYRTRTQEERTCNTRTDIEKTTIYEGNQQSRTRTTRTAPLESLIKNLDSKVLEFAGAKPEESKEGFGYSSFDGTVSFTAAEITKLGLDCYALTNVYGQVRSLAESSWVVGMRPTDRKRAIINKIKKDHATRVRNFAPDKVEQREVAKQQSEDQQDQMERARKTRERLMGGRRAG